MSEFDDCDDFDDFNDFSGFDDFHDFSGFDDFDTRECHKESAKIDYASGPKEGSEGDALNFSGFVCVNEAESVSSGRDNCDLNNNNYDNDTPNRELDIGVIRNKQSFNDRMMIKVGTWNVRTMSQNGKFEEVQKEMK